MRGHELAADGPWPGRASSLELRAHAVGPALGFAQIHGQALEGAAQDLVCHQGAVIVGIFAFDTGQSDADRRLRGPRFVDKDDAWFVGCFDRGQLDGGNFLGLPTGKQGFDFGVNLLFRDVACHDQDGVVGCVEGVVESL